MKKILVLEDDQDIGEIVEIALSDKYKTMVKRNDENLLGQLDQFQPDLLLIDNSLGQVKAKDVMESIKSDDKFKLVPFILFSAHHDLENLAIELVNINNGYQFLTKKTYHPVISLLQLQRSKKKLSQAALETLAIVAYKQPVTKTDVEQIRGVNCDYSIQKLLEKELITITGKSESVGKPLLYSTSTLFMDYFGINNIEELPHIKELNDSSTSIGEHAE